eukprot:3556821-Lingulodinium_polyedra.AAC.1
MSQASTQEAWHNHKHCTPASQQAQAGLPPLQPLCNPTCSTDAAQAVAQGERLQLRVLGHR